MPVSLSPDGSYSRMFGVRGDHVVDYQSRWEISPPPSAVFARLYICVNALRQHEST